ncbi:hypothetical protein TNCV_1169001 [Trichonephila clavipes]|uniref:Uncharacterized protein n=1 Tax=Trichonephila clavipes TaxID=2585209 RepID=A0A8X6T6Z0_TRICX|nr:hypothetical protein TNCV_1169001 [Trichonephila clavipes]
MGVEPTRPKTRIRVHNHQAIEGTCDLVTYFMFESCTRAIGDGPRNFETHSSDEDVQHLSQQSTLQISTPFQREDFEPLPI